MRGWVVLAVLLALLPAAGAAADPAASVFPGGWRQGWARSVEGRKLSYRWGNPGFAVSLLCRAVDATWAVEWEGEPAAGGGRDGHLGVARGAEQRDLAPPLRAAARRPRGRHVRHGRRDGEPHVDGRGPGRRAAPAPDHAHRQLRRALRLHGPDRAPRAGRGRPATVPHRAGGGREPGLRARLRGAGHGVGEGGGGGGRAEGRAPAAHRRRQPPRARPFRSW